MKLKFAISIAFFTLWCGVCLSHNPHRSDSIIFEWEGAGGPVHHYEVYVSKDGKDFELGQQTQSPTPSCTLTLLDGVYKIKVQAVDAEGNRGTMSEESETTMIESAPPVLEVSTNPAAVVEGEKLTITAKSEPKLTVIADVSPINPSAQKTILQENSNEAGTYSAEVSVGQVAEGMKSLSVEAIDAVGNRTVISVSVSVRLPDGSGTISVSPASVEAYAPAEIALIFTAQGVMDEGMLSITIPEEWTLPQAVKGSGLTVVTSSGEIGELSFEERVIAVPITSLQAGGTITILYGAGGGQFGTIPEAPGETVFEARSSTRENGSLVSLEKQSSLLVTAHPVQIGISMDKKWIPNGDAAVSIIIIALDARGKPASAGTAVVHLATNSPTGFFEGTIEDPLVDFVKRNAPADPLILIAEAETQLYATLDYLVGILENLFKIDLGLDLRERGVEKVLKDTLDLLGPEQTAFLMADFFISEVEKAIADAFTGGSLNQAQSDWINTAVIAIVNRESIAIVLGPLLYLIYDRKLNAGAVAIAGDIVSGRFNTVVLTAQSPSAIVSYTDRTLGVAVITAMTHGLLPTGAEIEVRDPNALGFSLFCPSGTSMIHIPLRVNEVNGEPWTLNTIADLYDVLGGAKQVSVLITYVNGWKILGESGLGRGTEGDIPLTDATGLIAVMKNPRVLRLKGSTLGSDGKSEIAISKGLNLVGVPLHDTRIQRVSDLFGLDGIKDNVSAILVTGEDGNFKVVSRAGDEWDILLYGGEGLILTAKHDSGAIFQGEAWDNTSISSPSPSPFRRASNEQTAILAVRGVVVNETAENVSVVVSNLSTRNSLTTSLHENQEREYQVVFVDVLNRAARVGDVLEVAVETGNPLIGVQPLRHVVSMNDVMASQIQLENLIAYEIPAETKLLPSYPNPFNSETWIPYRLAKDSSVILTIHDMTGKLVRTIPVGHRYATVYESKDKAIHWDGRNDYGESVASGIYFYTFRADEFAATQKMLLLK